MALIIMQTVLVSQVEEEAQNRNGHGGYGILLA
jgi:hypothetical protein